MSNAGRRESRLIEYLSDPHFWARLLQIIGVDIILAGDNAVVIALACRNLEPRHRNPAIIAGSLGAVALRVLFVFFVVWLMAVPYLKAVGGLLLLWIGVKLLQPEDEHEASGARGAASLWGAIRTIIIADAVMSLDNVIAIAAASRGDTVLLVLGLLISIPLVVFGSQLILKVLIRWPMLVIAGGGLLGWIAGDVTAKDPAFQPWIDANAYWLHHAAPAAGAAFVIVVGLWLKRRARERARRIEDLALEEKR